MRTLLYTSTLSLLSALMMQTGYAEPIEIGVNTAVKGNVTIKTGEQDALQAIVTEPVFLDDLVNSPRLGTLQVLLADATTFTVGPDCILRIDRFVYDPDNTEKNELKAKVTKGMFRFMSGNISKTNSQKVSVETPVASLGVRGTIVEGLVGKDVTDLMRQSGLLSETKITNHAHASLFVLRGPGQNSRSKHRKGKILITSGSQTVTVEEANMAVFVSGPDAVPMGPFRLPESFERKFDGKLRTSPTGGPSFRPFEFDMDTRDNPRQVKRIFTNGQNNIGEADRDDSFSGSDNPVSDMDWPNVYEDSLGNPVACNPNNPHFPNC